MKPFLAGRARIRNPSHLAGYIRIDGYPLSFFQASNVLSYFCHHPYHLVTKDGRKQTG
jgi:hypothetical protein